MELRARTRFQAVVPPDDDSEGFQGTKREERAERAVGMIAKFAGADDDSEQVGINRFSRRGLRGMYVSKMVVTTTTGSGEDEGCNYSGITVSYADLQINEHTQEHRVCRFERTHTGYTKDRGRAVAGTRHRNPETKRGRM